jgi:hypothetical protein
LTNNGKAGGNYANNNPTGKLPALHGDSSRFDLCGSGLRGSDCPRCTKLGTEFYGLLLAIPQRKIPLERLSDNLDLEKDRGSTTEQSSSEQI